MTERHETQPHPIDVTTPIFKGFIRGMLPLYLLMLLKRGSMHGTELIQAFGEMSAGHWKPSPGSVYPVLRRLEKEGLVAGRWRRSRAAPQRVYRLTKEGKQQLPNLQAQLLDELHRARALIDEHITALEPIVKAEGGQDG